MAPPKRYERIMAIKKRRSEDEDDDERDEDEQEDDDEESPRKRRRNRDEEDDDEEADDEDEEDKKKPKKEAKDKKAKKPVRAMDEDAAREIRKIEKRRFQLDALNTGLEQFKSRVSLFLLCWVLMMGGGAVWAFFNFLYDAPTIGYMVLALVYALLTLGIPALGIRAALTCKKSPSKARGDGALTTEMVCDGLIPATVIGIGVCYLLEADFEVMGAIAAVAIPLFFATFIAELAFIRAAALGYFKDRIIANSARHYIVHFVMVCYVAPPIVGVAIFLFNRMGGMGTIMNGIVVGLWIAFFVNGCQSLKARAEDVQNKIARRIEADMKPDW